MGRIEWPTVGLIAGCYVAFATLIWFHAVIPAPLLFPCLVIVMTFHGSLQHEALHGHPTRNRLVNEALVFLNLAMVYPYLRYRQTHLQHHNDERLTDPFDDPESYYVNQESWNQKPLVSRQLLTANNSFWGRMILGPLIGPYVFLRCEFSALLRGSAHHWRAWSLHAIAMIMIWTFILWTGIVWWHFLLFALYPATSLSLVRSFLEHQAHDETDKRSAIVEAGWLWRLLFLNNNFHLVHHKYPAKPWYLLSDLYWKRRDEFLAMNGGYLLKGYAEVARTYGLKPKEPVEHPILRRANQADTKA